MTINIIDRKGNSVYVPPDKIANVILPNGTRTNLRSLNHGNGFTDKQGNHFSPDDKGITLRGGIAIPK